MLAAMNGHTAAVKLLLDMGSDINAQVCKSDPRVSVNVEVTNLCQMRILLRQYAILTR